MFEEEEDASSSIPVGEHVSTGMLFFGMWFSLERGCITAGSVGWSVDWRCGGYLQTLNARSHGTVRKLAMQVPWRL